MGILRWFTAIGIILLDFFGMVSLFLVFRGAMWMNPALAIPLVVVFLFLALVVPVLVVAFLILGPVERARARSSIEETRGGGYVSNYPGLPMRFADYRPTRRHDGERRLASI